MTAETTLTVPQGTFELLRHRHRAGSPLRAWDAADEYLLRHVADLEISRDTGWVLANDAFGALATALATRHPAVWSDSVLAHRATIANLERNGIAADAVQLVPSTHEVTSGADVVLVKIPRTLALLEDQLHRLRPALHDGSVVIGAAMTKAVHTSTIRLFESVVGPTTTSRAVKKARLLFSSFDGSLAPGPSRYPTEFTLDSGHTVVNHANVFSRARLDIGTRELLRHLPTDLGAGRVADLGCGNGVVALSVALANPEAQLHLADSSYMAVASAEATMRAAFGSGRVWTAAVGDCLETVADGVLHAVVVNPPFHDDTSRSQDLAWHMFADACRALRPGGRLLVVGNRHLGHHVKLGRLFGRANVAVVAGSPKFVVLQAIRPE